MFVQLLFNDVLMDDKFVLAFYLSSSKRLGYLIFLVKQMIDHHIILRKVVMMGGACEMVTWLLVHTLSKKVKLLR